MRDYDERYAYICFALLNKVALGASVVIPGSGTFAMMSINITLLLPVRLDT